MGEVTSESFFSKLNVQSRPSKMRFGLCCTEERTLNSILENLDEYATHPLVDHLYFSEQNLCSDKNAVMASLEKLRDDANIVILISKEQDTYKYCFDHLQLRQQPFSALTCRRSLAGGDQAMTMQDLAKPWMRDQTVVGVQKHRSLLTEIPDDKLNLISLSQAQTEIRELEPLIRRADLLDIDLLSVKNPDRAIGLDAQQISQITHYAGRGTSTQILSILIRSDSPWHVECAATAIWYFLYGLTLRATPTINKMRQYTLTKEIEGSDLAFYLDESTQHWWCSTKSPASDNDLIPCSYRDYEKASERQELSDRLSYLLSIG